MLKQSNEEYDLSTSPFGFHEAERAEGWQEVTKVSPDPRYEAWDVEEVYSEFLDIGQRGEVA